MSAGGWLFVALVVIACVGAFTAGLRVALALLIPATWVGVALWEER